MIPSENLKFKHQRLETPARGYKFPGGTYSHGFCLNSKAQTVSIWDCSTDTVVDTVTLTAGKSFCSAFYRSIDKRIYVFGSAWVDGIDFDPDSGTFGDVVVSQACEIGSAVALSYLPFPFDAYIPGRGTVEDFIMIPHSEISDTTPYYNRRSRSLDGRVYAGNPDRLGHQNIVFARYHPDNNLIEVEGTFYRVLKTQNNWRTDNFFTLVPIDLRNNTTGGAGANALGGSNVHTYLFKNFLLQSSGSSTYVTLRKSTSNILQTITHGAGSSGRLFYEYDPFSRRVMLQGKIATQGSVFELGKGQLTDLGDLSRGAYLATNETGTEDMVFNPVHRKVYVQGRRHGAAGEVGVDRVYIYDLSQALGSMYLGYMTVGENAGAVRSSAYAVNTMGFNGNRYSESDHTI